MIAEVEKEIIFFINYLGILVFYNYSFYTKN